MNESADVVEVDVVLEGKVVDTIRYEDPVARLCRELEAQGCETVVRRKDRIESG